MMTPRFNIANGDRMISTVRLCPSLPAVAYLGKKTIDIIANLIEAKLKTQKADKRLQVKIFGPNGELLKTIDKD